MRLGDTCKMSFREFLTKKRGGNLREQAIWGTVVTTLYFPGIWRSPEDIDRMHMGETIRSPEYCESPIKFNDYKENTWEDERLRPAA